MITPCFILLTLINIQQTQIMVNGRKIAAIFPNNNTVFASGTNIKVNNTIYNVKESPVNIKAAIKQECGK